MQEQDRYIVYKWKFRIHFLVQLEVILLNTVLYRCHFCYNPKKDNKLKTVSRYCVFLYLFQTQKRKLPCCKIASIIKINLVIYIHYTIYMYFNCPLFTQISENWHHIYTVFISMYILGWAWRLACDFNKCEGKHMTYYFLISGHMYEYVCIYTHSHVIIFMYSNPSFLVAFVLL